MPKFSVKVRLIGEDGNAFFILSKVKKALRNNGVSREEIESFMKEATSGDYDNLLQTCMRWVEVH
jgi:hypothetical protein